MEDAFGVNVLVALRGLRELRGQSGLCCSLFAWLGLRKTFFRLGKRFYHGGHGVHGGMVEDAFGVNVLLVLHGLRALHG